jgi:UDP-N-acetylmuramoylalanine--D-glutamate ligase
VAELSGVRYINDSKGTNPDASIKALEAIERDILLIAGGYDKQADYSEWIRAFQGRVRHLLLMGATAGNIREAAVAAGFTEIHLCEDMATCVKKAATLAVSGDTVLLSPACASWDMYERFEDRGDDFKNCVKALVSKYG